MKDIPIIRIQSIELKNFKNVENGTIEMPSFANKDFSSSSGDILGIYGQNGTGKTAVVEAMEIIQNLLQGKPLPPDTSKYITRNKESCTISVIFAVTTKLGQAKLGYSVSIERAEQESNSLYHSDLLSNKNQEQCPCILSSEAIKFSIEKNGVFTDFKEFMRFSSINPMQFSPQTRYNAILKLIGESLSKEKDTKSSLAETRMSFSLNAMLAQRNKTSFIFNNENIGLFVATALRLYENFQSDNKLDSDINVDFLENIVLLNRYAFTDLFLISHEESGMINAKLAIPIAYVERNSNVTRKGSMFVSLENVFSMPLDDYKRLKSILHTINIVMPKIIPNFEVELVEYGKEILQKGEEGVRVQLLSKRGDISIPLGSESAGIIKITSILNALIYVYNSPSACLIVDELDAGIFEFLLGELLKIFNESAKGQIIFTSHNLRALEVLEVSNMMFSTTNPAKRYIKLKGVKTNNNLRDFYFRAIQLGGQDESLYMQTKGVEISRAFRKAGKISLAEKANEEIPHE